MLVRPCSQLSLNRLRRLPLPLESPEQQAHRRRREKRLLLLSLALGLVFCILFGCALFYLNR